MAVDTGKSSPCGPSRKDRSWLATRTPRRFCSEAPAKDETEDEGGATAAGDGGLAVGSAKVADGLPCQDFAAPCGGGDLERGPNDGATESGYGTRTD